VNHLHAVLRPASTVLVLRDEPTLQVLMVHRHASSPTLPGAMVFPGGKVDAADHADAWAEVATGWDAVSPAERPFRVAAIRELFEETGILLARPASDASAVFSSEPADLDEPFLDIVRRRRLAIDLAGLVPYSRWLTPPVVPQRFDTVSFLARMPSGQEARFDGRETVCCEWHTPEEALRLGHEKQRIVVMPTRLSLKRLGEANCCADALTAASLRPMTPVEPKVETRDGQIHIVIDASHGYGDIIERFVPPARPAPA